MHAITDQEFADFQRFIYDHAGITLSTAKKALVSGRLAKRLALHNIDSYADYFSLIRKDGGDERQTAIDLLTTNETYFFREPKHFEVLRRIATERRAEGARAQPPMRVWSAASSTGEEAYTIAMVLKDCLQGKPFEVLGTDISTRVLQRARTAHYPEQRTRNIPPEMLKRYCLKGQGAYAGTLLVDRAVRAHVRFSHANLNTALPAELGTFDVIFLRNVMIYFNGETKHKVVARVLSLLRPGGYLFIGHSESLHGVATSVQPLMPSVYIKP